MAAQAELLPFAAGDRLGFRLQRLEVLNWGTFHQRVWKLEPGGADLCPQTATKATAVGVNSASSPPGVRTGGPPSFWIGLGRGGGGCGSRSWNG